MAAATERPVLKKQDEAAPAKPASSLVRMIKTDAANGSAEEIYVHPSTVADHKEAGWLVVKGK